MLRVGIIGLGGMGTKHLDCYSKVDGAEVVAVADCREEKLQPGISSTEINIGDLSASVDPDRQELYSEGMELIADENLDVVDICLPTFLHADYTVAALQAGKHVLCEKPMALTAGECDRMLAAAADAPGKLMIAHCVRFFPEYAYLKCTMESGRLGRLTQLDMWRGGSPPTWSWEDWLLDHKRSGGFLLDLHIHDADFVQYLLGAPRAALSRGQKGISGGYDVVTTQYIFDDPAAVTVGANMGMSTGFGFNARFQAVFEGGSLGYDMASGKPLSEATDDGVSEPNIPADDGYVAEIEYFVDCIERGEAPTVVTPESGALSVRICAAELESIESGRIVELG